MKVGVVERCGMEVRNRIPLSTGRSRSEGVIGWGVGEMQEGRVEMGGEVGKRNFRIEGVSLDRYVGKDVWKKACGWIKSV